MGDIPNLAHGASGGSKFPMQEVQSSNITHIGFQFTDIDKGIGTLRIMFKGGKTYRYAGVPKSMHDHMMSDISKGKFFHKHIRGKYETTQEGLYE